MSVNAIPFLSFKWTTQAHLLKIINKACKKRIPLLNVLNNCISAKSAPKILSIKDECTFCFLNFVIIDLRNSLANCLFSETTSELIPVPLFEFYKSIHKRSSLENYTSNNTTQQETTRVQHDTTRDNTSTIRGNTSTTRHNTSATRDNTSTTRVQNNITFTYIIAVYSGPGILGSKPLFIFYTLETENCFFQWQAKQN